MVKVRVWYRETILVKTTQNAKPQEDHSGNKCFNTFLCYPRFESCITCFTLFIFNFTICNLIWILPNKIHTYIQLITQTRPIRELKRAAVLNNGGNNDASRHGQVGLLALRRVTVDCAVTCWQQCLL